MQRANRTSAPRGSSWRRLAIIAAPRAAMGAGGALAGHSSAEAAEIRACVANHRIMHLLEGEQRCKNRRAQLVSWSSDGPPGPQGPAGIAGAPGAQGSVGPRGEPGASTRGLWRCGFLLGWLAIAAGAFAEEAAAPGSLLVVDNQTRAVIRIDPATGTQSVVTSGNLITDPQGLAVNESTGEIYVANLGPGGGPPSNVVRIDPVTTEQRVIASAGQLFVAVGVAVGPDGDVFVAEFDQGQVAPR